MPARQRKKESKQDRNKGPTSKKKVKGSDELWKVVLAFVLIILLATVAIYFVSGDNSSKVDKKDAVKETTGGSQTKQGDKVSNKKPTDPYVAITNQYDKTISKQLADAEKLLKNKDFDRAHRTYEKLVKNHPDSPRAMYGLGRSQDELAEVRRSNEILQQAIDTLGKVGKVKECPPSLTKLAVVRQAERLAFLGKSNAAAKVLKELSKTLPRDIDVWNKMGVQFLLSGQNGPAKNSFQEALNVKPGDGYALVHLGFIIKSESNYKDAIPLLEQGLATNEPGTDDSRFYFHLGDAHYRLGRAKEAYEVYDQGAKKGHFLSKMQRSLYNADTPLRAKPFWTPDETPYLKSIRFIEKNWKVIRDEGVALFDSKKGAFVAEEEGLREKGDWQQFTMFFQGKRDNAACNKAPQTCKLVEKIPEAAGCKRGQVKFSVMTPGTHIWAHCGPTNCRIRGHLGLVIPKDVTIRVDSTNNTWQEGKMIIIDDSIEHEVWHNGTSFRMILIIDFWHPDLTRSQRDNLSPI